MNRKHPAGDRTARALAWALSALLVIQTVGCAGGTNMRIIPRAQRVSMISPWMYFDLWQALEVGRGVLVGTLDGRAVSGAFVSGGAKSIVLHTSEGTRAMQIRDVRYLINVLDMSHSRDGAIAGGLIGLGTGLTLAYMSNGQSSGTTAARPARATGVADGTSDESSSGESAAAGESESTNSESSAGTTPSQSSTEGGSSTSSDAYDTGQGASSESSTSTSDPTTTGSSTYDDGGTQGSSGGSSTGGGGGTGTTTTDGTSSSESSGNSVVYVSYYGEDEGSTSSTSNSPATGPGGTAEQPTGTRSSPAMRALFYAVTFAAVGTFVGWLIGRSMRKKTPRVDYVLFPANLDDQAGRTPEQYLADQIVAPSTMVATETLIPGSRFDSPRSAQRFDQFAGTGKVVEVSPWVGPMIGADDARAFSLFPTIDDFQRAAIVRVDEHEERTGTEFRYIAVITHLNGGVPEITLNRLTPRDVITIATQVNLVQAGIL